MSNPRLPEEVLDYIVDNLDGDEDDLENCCLVSKSWIPRTRKHLFADISLDDKWDLKSWKNAFPDPSTSPARYAKTLAIGCPEDLAIEDVVGGSWFSAFSRVAHLAINIDSDMIQPETSLAPFHGLSPVIKSLRIRLEVATFPSSPIFNLIQSFPSLEDLDVEASEKLTVRADGADRQQTPVQTSVTPAFSGSLKLYLAGASTPLLRPLLSLPTGPRFRELWLTCDDEEDISLAAEVVERCCSTLKSLKIKHEIRMFVSCSFQLRWLTPVP